MIDVRMPLAYTIDPVQRFVTITGDYAEAAEWRVLLETIAGDGEYRPGFCFIRDLRTSVHPVSAQAVVEIITVVREFWERLGVRRAAIVTRPGIDLPAVVAQALATDARIPLQVFTSYGEAVAWLRDA